MDYSKKLILEKYENILCDMNTGYNFGVRDDEEVNKIRDEISRISDNPSFEEWHTTFTSKERDMEIYALGASNTPFDRFHYYYSAIAKGIEPSIAEYLECLRN